MILTVMSKHWTLAVHANEFKQSIVIQVNDLSGSKILELDDDEAYALASAISIARGTLTKEVVA